MKHSIKQPTTTKPHRRGAVIVLIALLLPVMVILAAFVINMAYVELKRTEMYIAADAAARAGGRELTVTRSQALARAKAQAIAEQNEVAGDPLTLADGDIVFGTANRTGTGRYNFTAGGANPGAMQVNARRTASAPDGAIPLVLPQILGRNHVETVRTAISTQVEVDIALVIDRSGSMAYAANEVAQYPPLPAAAPPGWFFCDPAPPNSRWLDVVAAVNVFSTELAASPTDELVSLITYADSATLDLPLTSTYSDLNVGMHPYTLALCPGKTNIGGGIVAGLNTLVSDPNQRAGAVKVIVVLTDGIHNIGTNPVTAATAAGGQGVLIFSVTFSNEADITRMQQVATEGKGQHFHATSGSDLSSVFTEIAKQLPTLLTE